MQCKKATLGSACTALALGVVVVEDEVLELGVDLCAATGDELGADALLLETWEAEDL